ncbi:hypothetical protein ASG32_02960 [Methylobacterium sp. Leaf361]|uniref:hypothetical protein n=1 Tax=Methylobacterium sp. Leaf361 TaxID=1736352 RepID=UPI00070180CC|nr:hypothetical protein [Methylobacterium sp. Leaf361]KQS81725.1 hypothetical protein ASG32_02960 [Methylobacterium sp. Leaf361]
MILTPFDPATLALIGVVIAKPIQEALVPAVARVIPTEPEDLRLTSAQAVALLPPDETIHVQVGQSRSRWRRGNVILAIRGGSDRRIALASRSAGFGLSFTRDTGESVLVQTDDAKVRGWLERQAKRAGE